ncbi:hypothetical protein J9303_13645 [Bacillaceae bacterium Marseille-Q3522]|nr:hypothetical protein [Bacillaceae bacterium Marseille-Q3522]
MPGIQVLGVLAVDAWVAVTMVILFAILKATVGIRDTKEEELESFDKKEHGLDSAYPDFAPTDAK